MTLKRGCRDEEVGERWVVTRSTDFARSFSLCQVTSTSNCTDYQSRRLHIRYRRKPPPPQLNPLTSSSERSYAQANSKPSLRSFEKQSLPFAHTLNGTAAAIPRLIVAILENGVRLEGDGIMGLDLPVALRPFWLGAFEETECNIRWV
jgi:seryl-tRNA synthetase